MLPTTAFTEVAATAKISAKTMNCRLMMKIPATPSRQAAVREIHH